MKKVLFSLFGVLLMLCVVCEDCAHGNLSKHSNDETNLTLKNNFDSETASNETDEIIDVDYRSQIDVKFNYLSLDYYRMDFNCTYYVGDISELAHKGVLECKLITNCCAYNNFGEYDFLKSMEYVFEIITYDASIDSLRKNFYLIDNNEANSIIAKSVSISEGSNLYYELLSSLNIEFTYKSNHQNEIYSISPQSVQLSKPSVDNQTILNHYLDITSANSDAGKIATVNGQSGFVFSSDDSIVNLIPKSYFRNPGIYKDGGSEWGYLINTYVDIGKNNISSLIIYDIDTVQADVMTPDIVEIKVVLHRNYKYYYDSDVVVSDVDNNYCIANPQYKESMKYFKPNNVIGAKSFPNPGDSTGTYNVLNDFGYSFGTVATKMSGKYKNNTVNQGDMLNNFFKTLICIFSDAIVTGALSLTNLPLGASFLFSQVAGWITESIVDRAFEKDEDPAPFYSLGNNRYGFQTTSFNDYSNFDIARQNEDLLKEIGVIVPDSDGNYTKTEMETPLLFKDGNDFISYRTNILASEKSDDYYAIISHSLKVDVFNDVSTMWFHFNPDYIGYSIAKWSYGFGKNSNPIDILLNSDGISRPMSFGLSAAQNVYFTPNATSYYYLLFSNLKPFTHIELLDYNNNLIESYYIEHIDKVDKRNNKIKVAENKFFSFEKRLEANKKYKINIYRNNEKINLFGTSEVSIVKKTGSISTIIASLSYKRKINVLSGNETNCLVFKPGKTNIYTFIASDDYSGSLDTYIEIRDSNKELIYSSETGAGSSRAMAVSTLKSNVNYFVIVRNKTANRSTYKLYAYMENYLPYIRGQNINVGFAMNFSGIKHYYYLVHYDMTFNGNLVIEFLNISIKRSAINVELIDYKGTKVVNHSITDSNNHALHISSNVFYVLHIYTNSSTANENCVLNIG